MERFYGEYYFRPKAAWRVVKKAIVNNDIPRLYKEAREYMALRSKRKKFVKEHKAAATRRRRSRMSAKARLLTLVVILSNVAGNLLLSLGTEISGRRTLAAGFPRRRATDSVDAFADDADELGRPQLYPACHRHRIRVVRNRRQGLPGRADFRAALGGTLLIVAGIVLVAAPRRRHADAMAAGGSRSSPPQPPAIYCKASR